MANLPPSDIEKDLLAYKQRRRTQLGTPLELHPATRRMLQGEVARNANRPLLTSEEAAKNFVRSFVMSNQQQGFWARYRPQALWGGGMVACLAFVLLILRNDPQQTARQNIFPDSLPATTPVENPPMSPAPSIRAAGGALREKEILARRMPPAPASGEGKVSATSPTASPNDAQPKGNGTAASGQLEEAVRRTESAAAPPTRKLALEPGTRDQAVTSGVSLAKTDAAVSRDADLPVDRMVADKGASGGLTALAKAMKSEAQPQANQAAPTKNSQSKPNPTDDFIGGNAAKLGIPSGAAASVPLPAVASSRSMLSPQPVPSGDQVSAKQRFRQLDGRSLYRQNFNSPPVPEVMRDFTFERRDDRIRIVDADGSTYEGAVLPVPTEDLAAKQAASGDLGKRFDQQAQANDATAPNAQVNYRFVATGLSRKLNQLVEFRGEWQPTIRQSSPASPAIEEARLGGSGTVATQAVALKATESKATSLKPQADAFIQPMQTQSSTGGQITGRVVVGGRNEFEVNAVPR